MQHFGQGLKASNRIIRRVALFLGIVLTSLSIALTTSHLLMPGKDAPVQPSVEPVAAKVKPEVVGKPVQLTIASIGVNTVVQPVGLTREGDMDVVSNIKEVAWYRLGPKPGEKGSAVIAGHYGSKYSGDVVFHNLYTLKVGDVVIVNDDIGGVRTFTVRLIRSYGSDDDATEVFNSNDGKAHLNLITCSGTWDASTKTYSERTVVFTDQETRN